MRPVCRSSRLNVQRGSTSTARRWRPISRRRFHGRDADYFRALDTPTLRGRPFAATDTAAAQPVAIVNREFAEALLPGEDPIGRRLRLINPEYPNDWRTIVGVADDAVRELDADIPPTIFTPFDQTPFMWLYVMVRVKGDPASIAGSIRSLVPSVDPG